MDGCATNGALTVSAKSISVGIRGQTLKSGGVVISNAAPTNAQVLIENSTIGTISISFTTGPPSAPSFGVRNCTLGALTIGQFIPYTVIGTTVSATSSIGGGFGSTSVMSVFDCTFADLSIDGNRGVLTMNGCTITGTLTDNSNIEHFFNNCTIGNYDNNASTGLNSGQFIIMTSCTMGTFKTGTYTKHLVKFCTIGTGTVTPNHATPAALNLLFCIIDNINISSSSAYVSPQFFKLYIEGGVINGTLQSTDLVVGPNLSSPSTQTISFAPFPYTTVSGGPAVLTNVKIGYLAITVTNLRVGVTMQWNLARCIIRAGRVTSTPANVLYLNQETAPSNFLADWVVTNATQGTFTSTPGTPSKFI